MTPPLNPMTLVADAEQALPAMLEDLPDLIEAESQPATSRPSLAAPRVLLAHHDCVRRLGTLHEIPFSIQDGVIRLTGNNFRA